MKDAVLSKISTEIPNFLKDLVGTLRESLLVLDADLKIIYANTSFYDKFLVTPKQTLGEKVFNLGNQQWDIPELRELLEKILPTKSVFNNFEVSHTFQTIGRKTMIINARQFRDGNNPMALILMVIEDITDEKMLMEAALQNAKLAAIGQLSAGIAHGLNSPITGIQNFLKVYHKAEEKGSEKEKELVLMLEACKYMGSVVSNLTLFAGKNKSKTEKIDLRDVVESTLLFTERQLVIADIQVVRDYDKTPFEILGNKALLQHVVLNLILNSKEAMHAGGKITIRIRYNKPKKIIVLEILDTGIGIEKKDLGKIFEPFFTTRRNDGGTGLGLSVAYGIIKEHKGNIKIESIKNKGTRVIVEFPLSG